MLVCVSVCVQEREVYSWPVKESLKSMLALGGSLESSREAEKKKTSETAAVRTHWLHSAFTAHHIDWAGDALTTELPPWSLTTTKYCHFPLQDGEFIPAPVDLHNVTLTRDLQVSGHMTSISWSLPASYL